MKKKFQLPLCYNLQAIVETSFSCRKYFLIFQCLPLLTFLDKTFGPHGCPLCDAGLEIKSSGL
ncbi:MAG: hypothetical protein EX330_06850 [Candidatus Brocadia sp. BROELEC01]|nr:hypothetical protein [Candidatus Brocadia sapporoensis]QQR67158.1 MAG: hypothetical protein IPI25_02710 [Candidatus Brocadia sp.]RZV58456.1 MAG: hypothetical protein EX330_06850 [Candidatus Brocadia sp. BROELEC01]